MTCPSSARKHRRIIQSPDGKVCAGMPVIDILAVRARRLWMLAWHRSFSSRFARKPSTQVVRHFLAFLACVTAFASSLPSFSRLSNSFLSTLRFPLGVRSLIFTPIASRSEEHTSELQSRPHFVCRLLL